MALNKILLLKDIPEKFFSNLDEREVALWVSDFDQGQISQEQLVAFIGLPWRMVWLETSSQTLLDALLESNADKTMHAKRGLIYPIGEDPADLLIPPHSLCIYLPKGFHSGDVELFTENFRRMAMLRALQKAAPREVLVLGKGEIPIHDLTSIIDGNFNPVINLNMNFLEETTGTHTYSLELLQKKIQQIDLAPSTLVERILSRYTTLYPPHRNVIRVKDGLRTTTVDITDVDDPERPLLSHFSLIEERHLVRLQASELTEEEFKSFFHDPSSSWRPYAASLPWSPPSLWKDKLFKLIKKVEARGAEANTIGYISAESGAGGTTSARSLAWSIASQGYPTLIAKPIPFALNAEQVSNYLYRLHQQLRRLSPNEESHNEVPSVIVFDRLHWDANADDIKYLLSALTRAGRRAVFIIVTSGNSAIQDDNRLFVEIGSLTHSISNEDVLALGKHLNKFLAIYGKTKRESQWTDFYAEHTVIAGNLSYFWIALSFWIQFQYDISDSIQSMLYKAFKENLKHNEALQKTILYIAAMSSERVPVPEQLFDRVGEYPISHYLEEASKQASILGLMSAKDDFSRYWGMIHDILGRLLLNAFFYDFDFRCKLGFEQAREPEHLRFMVLREISGKKELAWRDLMEMGKKFAMDIFKIDPDHGHLAFLPYWREVLEALGEMPSALSKDNRAFIHHTAITRRRIATCELASIYGVKQQEKKRLLTDAIDALKHALFLPGEPGTDKDINIYNTLANAYINLEKLERDECASPDRLAELRELASEATRKAYQANPSNSYTIETHLRNLIRIAEDGIEKSDTIAIGAQALEVIFRAMHSGDISYRKVRLGRMAEELVELMRPYLNDSFVHKDTIKSEQELLLAAWAIILQSYRDGHAAIEAFDFYSVQKSHLQEAFDLLSTPLGQVNSTLANLRYQIRAVLAPYDFTGQLEELQSIALGNIMLPQQELEYGILLYQGNRSKEASRQFGKLRRMWRDNDYFVHVPTRLRWLFEQETGQRRVVRAVVDDSGFKAQAKVMAFENQLVAFRPEEFGFRRPVHGQQLQAYVTFFRSGPFLRPLSDNDD